VNDKFPRIQRLAAKLGADIGFEDEAGVGVMTRSGRRWGWVGDPPIVNVSMQRGGYHLLSRVTPHGDLRYSLEEGPIETERYIQFLKQRMRKPQRPLILLTDRAPFPRSKKRRDFVRAPRGQLRVYFLPRRAPELNPDEPVGNEVKDNKIGKQPVQGKKELKKRLHSAIHSLQKNTR
jgi:hypothetical protein